MLLAAKLARWGDRLLTLAAALLLGALALFGGVVAVGYRRHTPRGPAGSDAAVQAAGRRARGQPLALPSCAPSTRTSAAGSRWTAPASTFPSCGGGQHGLRQHRRVRRFFAFWRDIFWTHAARRTSPRPYSIVYGHHIEDGGMFGDIVQFTQSDYFAAHTTGTLITDDTAYNIALFACVRADAYDPCSTTPPKARTHCWPTSRRTRCSTARRAAGQWWPFPPAPRPPPTAGVLLFGQLLPQT